MGASIQPAASTLKNSKQLYGRCLFPGIIPTRGTGASWHPRGAKFASARRCSGQGAVLKGSIPSGKRACVQMTPPLSRKWAASIELSFSPVRTAPKMTCRVAGKTGRYFASQSQSWAGLRLSSSSLHVVPNFYTSHWKSVHFYPGSEKGTYLCSVA